MIYVSIRLDRLIFNTNNVNLTGILHISITQNVYKIDELPKRKFPNKNHQQGNVN